MSAFFCPDTDSTGCARRVGCLFPSADPIENTQTYSYWHVNPRLFIIRAAAERVHVAVTLQTRICGVFDSILNRDTGYPKIFRGFP
jgi:hypothetical protein